MLTRIGPERETDFCFDRDTDLFKEISQNYADVHCVLVDESQFLTPAQADQLMKVVTRLDIPVMAYGLRLNFRLEDGGFEGATRLLQIAHDIEEIKTICECGRKATYNARFLNGKLVADGPDVLIDDGTIDIEYRAICPACYEKYLEESASCSSENTPVKVKKEKK